MWKAFGLAVKMLFRKKRPKEGKEEEKYKEKQTHIPTTSPQSGQFTRLAGKRYTENKPPFPA